MIIFTASLRFCGQPRSGHAGAEMEGCKQVSGRSGWAPDGAHPVDGWPCDNLTHQPPPPLLCTITQADKQASTTEPGPERVRRGGAAQAAAVSPVCYGSVSASACVPLCIHFNAIVCRPDIPNMFTSCRNDNCLTSPENHFFPPPFPSGRMKYEYVTMAITIFGFCLHAVMRQSIPIIRHYNHQ